MALLKSDKKILSELGYKGYDAIQIGIAMQKRYTSYVLDSKDGTVPITREQAIRILGRKKFLAGLARSAFHFTASQKSENGDSVYFDSSIMFRKDETA